MKRSVAEGRTGMRTFWFGSLSAAAGPGEAIMSIAVVAELFFVPEAAEAVKAGMGTMLPETRAFAGCESVTLHQDQNDRGHLVLLERWASREAYQAYLDWRASQGQLGEMPGSTAPLKITFLDIVDV